MKKHKLSRSLTLLAFFSVLTTSVFAQIPKHYYVEITSGNNKSIVKLYNETPLHRDNFVKLVREGYYDSLLFHRVINHFMIQGGDPGSRYSVPGQRIGTGGPEYKIDAEILPDLIHKKGAIGAARDGNPEKKSSASQFYLVQGKVFTEAGLDSLETMRLKKKMTAQQRQAYSTVGGTPHLDGEYTVFGEVIDGMDLVDKIAVEETDEFDRPLKDQRMYMRVLPRKEALVAENGPDYEVPKDGFFKRLFGKRGDEQYTIEEVKQKDK